MAPAAADLVSAAVAASPLESEYGQQLDRESAYERLQAKLAPPPSPAAPVPAPAPTASGPTEADDDAERPSRTRQAERGEPSVVTEVVQSTAFKSFVRSAGTVLGREITRSLFGTASRSRTRRR
jgi:hypothetical protein